jgi:hypothetical protein
VLLPELLAPFALWIIPPDCFVFLSRHLLKQIKAKMASPIKIRGTRLPFPALEESSLPRRHCVDILYEPLLGSTQAKCSSAQFLEHVAPSQLETAW